MRTRTILLFGAVFGVVIAVISVSAGKGWQEKMKKCNEGEINIEEVFKGKKECKEEMEAKQEEASGGDEEVRRRRSPHEGGKKKGKKGGKWKKNMCFAVCQWKKTGVLDESGQFSESGALSYAKAVYPEQYQTEAFEKLKECSTNHSSEFSMDDNCSGYGKFKKCVFRSHMKVCGIEMGGKKGDGSKQDPPPSANEEATDER